MADWGPCVEHIEGYADVPKLKCLEVIFQNILTAVVALAVIALFVMLTIGGFKYLTSGGDQKATASAQQTMTYAIAGIALMAVAYIIFRIIETYTGVPVTNFVIPEIGP